MISSCFILALPLPHGHRLLIDSFSIPDYLVAAPIAADWAKYNSVDNRGEVLGIEF
jgi:acyl-CoA oxidase